MHTLAHGNGDAPGPWLLLFPLIWAAVVVAAVTLLRRTVRRGHRAPWWPSVAGFAPHGDSRPTGDSPIAMLGRRFASGEIDEDEYWRRLYVLDEQFGRSAKGG